MSLFSTMRANFKENNLQIFYTSSSFISNVVDRNIFLWFFIYFYIFRIKNVKVDYVIKIIRRTISESISLSCTCHINMVLSVGLLIIDVCSNKK